MFFLTSFLYAQEYTWSVSSEGIFRNGVSFIMRGQSWAKKTQFTYNRGTNAESDVKQKLTQLHEIGVNVIRVYGSPDDSDWSGSSNYGNLIKWIEEWNILNPDGGNPNNAMYYMVQISPADTNNNLPQNTAQSFNQTISDLTNSHSVASLIKTVTTKTTGSKYLLGYLIYHELNISSKYIDWYNSIGAAGIESFMNTVADSIHSSLAPGKLVSHTGDATEPVNDIYNSIELLDQTSGNVFKKFDLLGFNLYISTNAMLKADSYYKRIVNRRAFSVNENRGWYIGETGASYDKEANSSSVALANYTNPQGGANLQMMWQKSKALGNLIGFMLFTVQDNDLLETVNNAMKQRGYFDYYGEKKFLYFIYPDVINEISTNNRFHSTASSNLDVIITENTSSYSISIKFENKTAFDKQFSWSIYGDNGSSSQRFSVEIDSALITLHSGEKMEVNKEVTKPSSNVLFAVTATAIKESSPLNPYLWGREQVLDDAICTIAGMNLNTENLPDRGLTSVKSTYCDSPNLPAVIRGKVILNTNQILIVPDGFWELNICNSTGKHLYRKVLYSSNPIDFDKILTGIHSGILIYTLKQIS